jgi:glutaredoxin-related protein
MTEFLRLVTYLGHLRIHMFDTLQHKHIRTGFMGYDMWFLCVCFYVWVKLDDLLVGYLGIIKKQT